MPNLTAKVHALGTKNKDGQDNKGTLSVYGLNTRFPISLYANQWRDLAAAMPAILAMCDKGLKDGTLAKERMASEATPADRVALSAAPASTLIPAKRRQTA